MISTVGKRSSLWTKWAVLVAVLLAVWVTLALTRPTAKTVSMTPLSGLMTLKTMAADSVPFDSAIASSKPTLIEFYADWCTTCQSMSSTMNTLHQQYGEHINFVMLNIDDPAAAPQVNQYRASGVPQFTLLSETQAPVDTWVGKVPAPIFTDAFAQLLPSVS
ncbi:MAG: thioredoxin domain-containing protein [Cyanobacteria bacterium J06634_5]